MRSPWPAAVRVRRRHRERILIDRPGRRGWRRGLAAAVALGALSAADRQGWLLVPRDDDVAAYHGLEVRVARVVDGDTIEIDRRDERLGRPTTRVRLWGVDCPDGGVLGAAPEPLAEAAAAFTRHRTAGVSIVLRIERQRTRGAFGRVLAHVDLPDGTVLNAALARAGLAVADDRWPHAELVEYASAERRARREGLGVWAAGAAP